MRSILDIGLTNALMASLLAITAFVAGRLQIRPALRHGLWLLVLLKLIAPPLWSMRIQIPARTVPIVEKAVDLELGGEPPLVTFVDPGPASPEPPPQSRMADTQIVSWQTIVAGVWFGGSILWLALALIRIEQFRRVLRTATPANESVREHVREIAARIGLRNLPRAVMTPGVVSPLVWGFAIVPRVVLPSALWARLGQDRRTTLLIHELAHLRRGDHFVRWLELVVTALYWWHPVVWLARRALRDAEEQCCDAWVVWAKPGSARAYADALLETVEFLSQAPGPPFAATGLGRVDHLKRRLTMILRGTTPRRLSWQGGLMMLGLAGVMLPLSPIAAQEEEKDTPQATVTTEAGPATPTLTGDNAGRILHLGIQQDIWPPDSIPTLLGEITIQEATGAKEEHGEKTEAPAARNSHVEAVEEFKKLRSDLSALQMARIEAEAELRVALENLKKSQAKIAQTDEPTTDETDAARAAASTVEKLKLDLELHRRAEAKTRTNLEAFVKLQGQIGYQRMNAPKVKKARAEVTDAQQRLHQAIIRAAEAEALLQPDPAEFTTTGPVNRKDKDGSSAASADAVSNPAPKVSPTIELGPDGRVAGSWRVEKSSTTESMVLYNKDGTITMFVVVEGKAGSKPKIQIRTLVRTDGKQAGSAKASDETNDFLKEYYDGLFKSHEASRLVPGDGEPNILSPEEQSLLEQEAEARKLLEEASRMVRKKSSDPALKHHRARLAEIQAKLQAIQAPKPDTDQRINALEEKLNDVLDELKRLQKDEER